MRRLTPVPPRPFSGDCDAPVYTSKSQKYPFALSARTQTLIPSFVFFGMYCLALDLTLKRIMDSSMAL